MHLTGARPWSTGVPLLALALTMGCRQADEIQVVESQRTDSPRKSYDVETARSRMDHMFAAIVPHGGKAWFFKVVAPARLAEQTAAAFDEFVGTVSLDGLAVDAKTPNWELPEGWKATPESGQRDATIDMQVDGTALELTVVSLPLGDDWTSFLSANVNRWLNQLGQGPLDAATVESLAKSKEIGGGTATVVELVGAYAQRPMSGQMPADHPPIEQPRAAETSAAGVVQATDELAFEIPPGWSAGRPSSMRKASFAVDGGVDISVTAFPNTAQMGDLAMNLQRWATEVGASAPDAGGLVDLAEATTVGGLEGYYAQLDGPDKTTLAAMIPRGDMIWFFKLWGPSAAVHPQRDAFRSFLDSVEFGNQ